MRFLFRQIHIHNRNLLGGLWALLVIRSVFEFKRASLRRRLFASRGPPAPSFNLIGPASTATFGFRPVRKGPRGAEQRGASATCWPWPPPSDFEFRVPPAALCFAQAPSLPTGLCFASFCWCCYCCLLLLLPSAGAIFCCCCLLLLSSTSCLCCLTSSLLSFLHSCCCLQLHSFA